MFVKRMTILLLFTVSMVFVSCATPTPLTPEVVHQPTATVAVLPKNLSPATVNQLRGNEAIVIIDVRQPEEYAEGHIPGAVLIPLGELANRLSEVPTDKPVILVCRSGNRSVQALQLLQEAGFTNGHNMVGGMKAWVAAGYSIEAER